MIFSQTPCITACSPAPSQSLAIPPLISSPCFHMAIRTWGALLSVSDSLSLPRRPPAPSVSRQVTESHSWWLTIPLCLHTTASVAIHPLAASNSSVTDKLEQYLCPWVRWLRRGCLPRQRGGNLQVSF